MTQRPLNLRGSHHEFALILSREETLPESGGLRSPHVRPAGRARTVHNIEVDTTHAYYVATTTATWTLAHNGCTDRIYSNRVLQRSAEKRIDPFHKFPYTFDEYILEHGERVFQSTFFDDVKPNLSRDGAKYTMPGSMRTKGRDYRGIYEIGVRLSENGNAEVIVRRFFRPEH